MNRHRITDRPPSEWSPEEYAKRVRLARLQSPEEKLLLGPRLFDIACKRVKKIIRKENPNANEDRVRELLEERLTLARKLEDAGESAQQVLPTLWM
ncbi:MAG: hypothetical protein IPK83_07175 [Planctomycetes bacterium]|nr:hypothetical protein [Planctomycetota bacterium]